jgi:hypothetical protein
MRVAARAAAKALLLRVGIDRGSGGALAPIFADGSFEYIPPPEPEPTRHPRTFAALPARHGGALAAFLPPRLAGRPAHDDPDFAAFVYGDAALPKRRQLLRLAPGDLLVFYAGLAPWPDGDIPRLFIIGWLAVAAVYDLDAGRIGADPALRRRFGDTAHFLRDPPDPRLALVAGEPRESRLLRHALPLGDGGDRLLRDLAGLGYQGSLRRAVGHWLRGPALAMLACWLRHGPAGLIGEGTRLFRVAAAALRPAPPACRGDLVVADPRPAVGDWVWAGAEGGGTLARINRRTPAGEALASLFWSFDAAAAPVPARPPADGAGGAALRRFVARVAARRRPGGMRKRA